MKVVINSCYGGFGLSEKARKEYKKRKGIIDDSRWYEFDIPRDDPVLIQLVEEMGSSVNSSYSELKIVEVPDDVNWQIEEYDGYEHIAEVHRTWK